MKEMNAEIIAVGTELLLGQIANTNAQWLSGKLADIGINVYYHSVVGDNLDRVQQVFETAQRRSDIVLVTGGLGPTEDDLTREAFAKMSGLRLIEDKDTVLKVKDFFAKQNAVMTNNNLKQAQVFETAQILPNPAGMAPGMILDFEGTIWTFLPGVPREMKVLASEQAFPFLASLNDKPAVIKSMVLRFSGIGESKLEDLLNDIIRTQSNPTIAPLAQEHGVILRLTAKAAAETEADALLEQTKQTILARTGSYFSGTGEKSLAEEVFELLKEKNWTAGAAESLTGGMFTDTLISIPGASVVCYGGIVSYDQSVKQHLLGVSAATLERFGTVSEQCATEMAEKAKELLGTDIGISFTGVAGPDESEGKPAGTVYIGLSSFGSTQVHLEHFTGDRQEVRSKSVQRGFELIRDLAKNK